MRFDHPLVVHGLNFFCRSQRPPVRQSGAAVSVIIGAVWAVWAHAGRAGHSSPLGRTPGENAGASWWKTTGVGGLTEFHGGFLGLLDVFTHVGRETWCSRVTCRAPFVEIF